MSSPRAIPFPASATCFLALLLPWFLPGGHAQDSAANGGFSGDLRTMSAPVNDLFPGEPIDGASGSVTGTNSNASKEPNEPRHAGETGGASVWWSWTAPSAGVYTFDTFGSDFDTLLAVYRGESLESLVTVARFDLAGFTEQSREAFITEAHVLYRIAVDGWAGETGSITLNWKESEVANNLFPGMPIEGASGSVEGIHADGIRETNEPNHAGWVGDGSVWWSWRAPSTGVYTFDTFRSDFDTLLAVYTGDRLEDLMEVASNDDAAYTDRSEVTFSATEGAVYRIAVDGWPWELVASVLEWQKSDVQPLTPFQLWAEQEFPEGQRNEIDDPGRYGIVNLLRFAFGMDAQRPDTRDLPQVVVDVITENGDRFFSWSMTYVRRTGDPGVAYIPQASHDLKTWTTVTGNEIVLDSNSAETEVVTITDTEPLEGRQERFFRVRLEQ